MSEVLIAGGGVAGLACASWLAGAGVRVTVLESETFLGGRASSWTDEVTGERVDIGPHVLSSEHRNFIALLERLGTAGQVRWQPDPLITLLDAGRALRMRAPAWPVPLHGLPALPNALRCVSPADLLSNLRLAWRATRMDEAACLALDGEDALAYLRRMGVSARFTEWFFASAVLALLNVPLESCSAASLMRVFRLMLGRSGWHFGFPTVGLADLFVPGARAAVEAAGGRVLTSAAVHALLVRDGRFEGVVLEDGRRLHAGAAVLALPPQAIAELGRRGQGIALEALARDADAFRPSPYVSTLLWLDRPVTGERFWARTVAAGDLNTDFYELNNIRSPGQGRPALIAANAIHAQAAWHWSDAQLVERTLREVREFAPPAAQAAVVHSRVHRIPMAIPCPQPGTERLRPANATPVEGLWLAGDWTATAVPCSMESAARSGALAAEAVAARLGQRLAVAVPAPETTGIVAALRRRSAPPRRAPSA
ncbi:hydroxysqualene dehydroxylase [Ramlibacter tataouinensis]|uniref:Carotene 7,8-desaturase (Zeta-carotene desaturase)-like protein n=1 Tax=Ramlibacter tataouinensis (strain ATCC BAA-407 / DSM 14655 / LMG 21543 / TTB310) TaxID=365046 RepID=F5Y5E1_RAMTT|nr:FAD-dependent oxidoreductase [Ramlibacter tataouinensis]AEG91451.1 carotene 7,8-desaturase (zeta-carotene desaturase)-like protein [Ramlibacter tataouinensis TTB310]